MRGLTLLLIAIFATSGLCRKTIKDFENEFHELWSDPEEEAEEAKILEEVQDEIEKQNKLFEEGKSSYKEALNENSLMPEEEFLAYKTGMLSVDKGYFTGFVDTGNRTLTPAEQRRLQEIYDELDRWFDWGDWWPWNWFSPPSPPPLPPAPQSFDARQQGWVTPVRNQGSCGSCAAFAALAAAEVCMAKAGRRSLDISEQQALDCGYGQDGAAGCQGASCQSYANWMKNHMSSGGKLSSENQYPYQASNTNNQCQQRQTTSLGTRVSEVIYDPECNESRMMKLVAKYGAVVTGLNGEAGGGIQSYSSGIFTGCSNNAINHAVTVVGYGPNYWIVKNSWGTGWGEQGYIKIKKGSRMCGIGSICVAMDCSKSNRDVDEHEPEQDDNEPALYDQVSSTCDVSSLYQRKDINGNYTLTTKSKCLKRLCTG